MRVAVKLEGKPEDGMMIVDWCMNGGMGKEKASYKTRLVDVECHDCFVML